MRRLWLLAVVLVPITVANGLTFAQSGEIYRLGVLSPSSVPMESIRSVTLSELVKDGFVEGRNLIVEQRVGSLSQLSRLAHELAADHPNAVVAVGGAAIRAIQDASDTIPIVGAFIGEDPIAAGFAKSFARPGGNVTGVVMLAPELDAKRLDLLREAVPHGDIAVLAVDPDRDKPNTAALAQIAARNGFNIHIFYAATPADYPAAFDAMKSARDVALVIASTPEFATNIDALTDLALKSRLATICEWPWMAQRGCLFSYGPIFDELHRRTAFYITSIFNGTPAGELPMELPVHFELVVNLKAAKTLGFTVPQTLLERADRTIE
jgi:putative tryptophan/tyrosine transport system substrate-binding protein